MKKTKNIFIACLIYIPTLVLIPSGIVFAVILCIAGIYFIYSLQSHISNNDIWLYLFLILSVLMYFIGYGYGIPANVSGSTNQIVPYTIFIVLTVIFSKKINNFVLKYILYFVLFEIVIGLMEFSFGKQYFIPPPENSLWNSEMRNTGFLYYDRVYGLSQRVSLFGQKVFFGFLLLSFLNIKRYLKIYFMILIIGLVISFNRSVIISSIIFFTLVFLEKIKSKKLKVSKVLIPILLLVILIINNIDILMYQFFKGHLGFEMSGRETIFPTFINFIREHWIFGNYGHRVWFRSGDRIFHAENSYLETIATFGVFLSVLIFVYIGRLINKKNFIYIFPCLVFSIAQYGILYSISFFDIMFYALLFSHPVLKK
jgi:hypothetical protein